MAVYFLIFIIFSSLYLIEDFIKSSMDKLFLFLICVLVLVFLAGLRSEEASTDYGTYLRFFNDIQSSKISVWSEISAEPFYRLIPYAFGVLGLPAISSFLFFAILGVSLKGIAILKGSRYWFGTLLIYFTYFYFLHEFTQIRIGVAAGIWLLSVPLIKRRKFWSFFLCIMLAVCFHYSAVFYLLTYWISDTKINQRKWFIILGLSFIFAFSKVNFLDLLLNVPIGLVAGKADFYLGGMSTGLFSSNINLFNAVVLIDLFILSIMSICTTTLELNQKFFNFYLKCYFASLICFFLLAGIPPFAFRIRELFQVVHIFLIPGIVYMLKEKIWAKFIVITIALAFLFIQTFYSGLVKPYI